MNRARHATARCRSYGRMHGRSIASTMFALVGIALLISAAAVYFSDEVELEASCQIGGVLLPGANQCTFTNRNTFLPARRCVYVEVRRTGQNDAVRSNLTCSGLVWPRSTAAVAIGHFDRSPGDLCNRWSDCELLVLPDQDKGVVGQAISNVRAHSAEEEIRNVLGDFAGISAAYNGYLDRFKQLPGDDACAGGVVTGSVCGTTQGRWSGAVPGNGDGKVAGKYNSTTRADESRQWWDHLRRAGFVSGTGDEQPLNKFKGIIGVQDSVMGFNGTTVCSANLPYNVAIAVDERADDGLPNNGKVRAVLQDSNPTPNLAQKYVDGGVYTVCREL